MNLEQRIDLKYEKMQNTALSNILPLWFKKILIYIAIYVKNGIIFTYYNNE